MKKEEVKHRRVLGHQVAVELPDEELFNVDGKGRKPVAKSFSTCDGTVTHHPANGRDCSGQTDDIGGLPI
ncbi:MAG TPA: hypothetical protein VIE43_01465 [Thermoanaerobaculia bacterium]|jgi:hypothetical protein|nr:hypothetical protein [Thermoanaerobaculia bacterium]